MSERYVELYTISGSLYLSGSPVIIEAGALLKDTQTGRVLAQLKIRNLSERVIVACKADIKAYEPNGTEIPGVPAFRYLDLNAGLGDDFGTKVPIILPDANTRKISACITEVVFSDGAVWSSAPCEWSPIHEQQLTDSYFPDPELRKQYELEVGGNCPYIPKETEDLFLCTCGAVNLRTGSRCHKCGRSFDMLMRKTDKTFLESKKSVRLENEKKAGQARALAAEAEAKRLKKQRTRMAKILLCAVALIVCAAVVKIRIFPLIETRNAYKQAAALLENGDYDAAEAAFEALGDYKDSSSLAPESLYRKAESLMDSGEFESAAEIWDGIEEYSDSRDRAEEARTKWFESDGNAEKYYNAGKLWEDGEYVKAINLYKELDGYSDSKEKYISSSYEYGCILMDAEKYDVARYYFGSASGYKDADAKKSEAGYNYGLQCMDRGDSLGAVSAFRELGDYKDSEEQWLEAQYQYVLAEKESLLNYQPANVTSYHYLLTLKDRGYKDSDRLYEEMFGWKVKITSINNVDDGNAVIRETLNRNDHIYFGFTVLGGPPDESLEIKIVMQLPGCEPSVAVERYSYWQGSVYEIHFTSNAQAGTASISFYDPSGNRIGYGSVELE